MSVGQPGRSAGESSIDRTERPRTAQLTGPIVVVALVSAVSGMLYGYDTGIISGALLQITKDFGIAEGWKQVIAAAILVGAVVGALSCSWLSERRGRKGTLVLLAVIFVGGSLWCAFSFNPVWLTLGRFVLGFAVGGATQTAPMYVAELSPPAYRGRLVLCFQIAIGVGILIATIVGASEALSWHVSIGAAAVPAAIMLLLMLRLPESPRWLVKHEQREDAAAVLRRVRPDGWEIDAELDEMAELAQVEETSSTRGWSGLRAAWVRPALVLGCGIAIFTQLSGIEMIIYYSPTILTDTGFSTETALLVSVGLGLAYLLAQLGGLAIIDKVGRRRLTLIMVPGAAAALVVVGFLFLLGGENPATVPWIITCFIVFMLFNAGGLQLMGWLTGSEAYPLAVRPAGTAAQSAALWGTNVLITLTLLSLITAIGTGPTMWLYAAFNIAAWIFLYLRMPDLTGKSLEDIEGKLKDSEFTPAGFARV